MIDKVIVNRYEIDKLIRMKKDNELKEYILSCKEMMEITIKSRVNKLIENKIILEKERNTFFNLLLEELNENFLKDDNYILLDENEIEKRKEEFNKLRSLKSGKR
jgi:hypothetical protein